VEKEEEGEMKGDKAGGRRSFLNPPFIVRLDAPILPFTE
jgi:hypothetical protein